MVDRTLVDALVKDLGIRFGFEELVLDDDGLMSLVVSDDVEVTLVFDEGAGDLILSSNLGQLDLDDLNDETGELLVTLLSANLYWQGTNGGTIGYNAEERQFVLAQRVSVQGCSSSNMESSFNAFAQIAQQWSAIIAKGDIEKASEFASATPMELRV